MSDRRPPVQLLSVWFALLALIPFVTLALPHELSLRAQAGGILVLLAICLIPRGGRTWRWPRIRTMPMAGMAAYAIAAFWGIGVGLLRGNPLRTVASQGLSMLFLPLAFVLVAGMFGCGFAVIVDGAAIAVIAGLGLHLALPLLVGRHFGAADLLAELPLDTDLTGILPLAIVLLAHRLGERGKLYAPALAAALVLLALSQTRGAWLATGLALLALAWLENQSWRRGLLRVAAGLMVVVVPLLLAALVLADRNATKLDYDLLEALPYSLEVGAEKAAGRPLAELDLPADLDAIEIRWKISGPSGKRLTAWADFRDAEGERLFRFHPQLPGLDRALIKGRVVAVPQGAASLRLGVWFEDGEAVWTIESLELSGLQGRPAARMRQARWRLGSFLVTMENPKSDETLAYRLLETRAVVEAWRELPAVLQIAGAGLGATFDFASSAFDETGERRKAEQTNYIHDFYLFLGFKLGIFGAVAIAGLVILLVWMSRIRDCRPALGVTAVFAAYLVWSLSSPEIYDFRVAPLWGVVLAALWREAEGEDSK